MTRLAAIFILMSALAAAQTSSEVNGCVKTVDSLRRAHHLKMVECPSMSGCGGAVKGYYLGDKLMYISSVYGAELGYSSRDVYFKDSIPYKIIYREYFADWEKHAKKYPNGDEQIEKHMTYTDTLYTIILSRPPVIYKSPGKEPAGKNMPKDLLVHLQECAGIMRKELESVKSKR